MLYIFCVRAKKILKKVKIIVDKVNIMMNNEIMKNERIYVRCTEEEKREIENISASQSRSMSNLLYMIVKKWLAEYKEKK